MYRQIKKLTMQKTPVKGIKKHPLSECKSPEKQRLFD